MFQPKAWLMNTTVAIFRNKEIYMHTGSSRLMRISLLRFLKTIT